MKKKIKPRARARLDTAQRRQSIGPLVQSVLDLHGWEPLALAIELGVSEQAVRSWLEGRHAPAAATLRALHELMQTLGAGSPPPWTLQHLQHSKGAKQATVHGSAAQPLLALRVGDWLEVHRQSNGGYRVDIGGCRWTFTATPGQNGKWDVASTEGT